MNKNLVTNLFAAAIVAAGYALDISWLKMMGLFALSGALTNWLAVYMLFDKVPGLYGSGVVQLNFSAFKQGISNLIMTQFFTEENIDKFLSDGDGTAHHFDLEPLIENADLSPAFNSLIETVSESSFGSMLGMFGGVEALAPLKEPFEEKLKASIIEISRSDSFAENLRVTLESGGDANSGLAAELKEKVAAIVQTRLDELTPKMVKDIIQEMIRSHLGWLVVWGGVFGGLIGLGAAFVA